MTVPKESSKQQSKRLWRIKTHPILIRQMLDEISSTDGPLKTPSENANMSNEIRREVSPHRSRSSQDRRESKTSICGARKHKAVES
jgi:hypothetical protein